MVMTISKRRNANTNIKDDESIIFACVLLNVTIPMNSIEYEYGTCRVRGGQGGAIALELLGSSYMGRPLGGEQA